MPASGLDLIMKKVKKLRFRELKYYFHKMCFIKTMKIIYICIYNNEHNIHITYTYIYIVNCMCIIVDYIHAVYVYTHYNSRYVVWYMYNVYIYCI